MLMSLSEVRSQARSLLGFIGVGEVIAVEHGKSDAVVGYIVGPDKVDALEGIPTMDALMRDVYHKLGKLRRLVVAGTAVRVRDGNAARSKSPLADSDSVLFWFLPVAVWEGMQSMADVRDMDGVQMIDGKA